MQTFKTNKEKASALAAMYAILHPALSNSQNAINVSEKLSAYVENEIYKTLDVLMMRK